MKCKSNWSPGSVPNEGCNPRVQQASRGGGYAYLGELILCWLTGTLLVLQPFYSWREDLPTAGYLCSRKITKFLAKSTSDTRKSA